jgi:hypothetical protein
MSVLQLLCVAGCATQQKHAYSQPGVALPIQVRGVVLVYQPARLGPEVTWPGDHRRERRELIMAALERAVHSGMPAEFGKAGIPVEITTAIPNGAAEVPSSWHTAYLTPLRAVETCYWESCSIRLAVGIRLVDSAGTLLWNSEVEEPFAVGTGVFDARFQELARQIAKSLLSVTKRAATGQPVTTGKVQGHEQLNAIGDPQNGHMAFDLQLAFFDAVKASVIEIERRGWDRCQGTVHCACPVASTCAKKYLSTEAL